MFDQLFKCSTAVPRHVEAPLYAERLQYLQQLQAQGAARKTLLMHAAYLLRINAGLHLKSRLKVTMPQLEAAANRWIARQGSSRCKTHGNAARRVFVAIGKRWLQFLGRLQTKPVKQPFASHLEAFVCFMREERNLSPVTIHTCRGPVAEFLRMIDEQGTDLGRLDIETIDRLIVRKAQRDGLCRVSMRSYSYALRRFLAYAESKGWCRRGLAAAIKPPRIYQDEALPAGPSWDAVGELLAATQSDRAREVRDHAILMLFALYGLRVAEVRRLCLEDLDWERALIRVHHSKPSQHIQCYPLVITVAEAIARYLRQVRPKTQLREVFLHVRAPYQPLSNSAFFRIVNRRVRPMGLNLKHYGPHALRHACATRLLERGLNMKEIGDFLGHRHPASTAIYAKVNMAGLRQVADFDLGRFL